jgi:release factor glutamine methyltransferase
MTTVAEALQSKQQLEGISDSAALDVELLLCHCLQKSRSYLRAWPEANIPEDIESQFKQLLQRRQQGEPVAYLLGERGFWTLDLAVSPATLIPRPETELLVEKALSLMADKSSAHVLDLGTGTGAIALALASEQPNWTLTASDVEPSAVTLAESNRQRLDLNNVTVLQSNWFESIAEAQFDLIVSNPPYIDPEDPHLQQGDVRFEPRSALVASNHGLGDIELIVAAAAQYLRASAWLVFEHGYDQGEQSRVLLREAGFTQVFTDKDIAGMDRISGGQWQG